MAVGKRRFIAVQPIEKWPGKTRSGVSSQFRASFTDTLDFLEKELEHLTAEEPTLLTLHSPDDVRLDGRLKTDTRLPSYQGVILTFKRKAKQHEHACDLCRRGEQRNYYQKLTDIDGPRYAHPKGEPGKVTICKDQKPAPVEFRFPADKYSDWKDNVRAIAMALEGLRMVERHGVKSEAQYAGYKALPAAAEPEGDVRDAAMKLARLAYGDRYAQFLDDMTLDRHAAESAYTVAAIQHHPDRGGSQEKMSAVNAAISTLRDHFRASKQAAGA